VAVLVVAARAAPAAPAKRSSPVATSASWLEGFSMQSEPRGLTLRDYALPIKERRWMILAILVLITAAVYVYGSARPKTYTASTKVYVGQTNDGVNVSPGAPSPQAIADEATLLTSTEQALVVAKKIGYTGSAQALAGSVTAAPAASTDFITITARASTGQEAARIANGFAQQFITENASAQRAINSRQIGVLQRQLKSLKGANDAAQRQSIAAQIQQLQLGNTLTVGSASQIDPALPPASPSNRPAWEYAGFAALAALIGAVLLAYLLRRLDPRLKTVEQAIDVYDRPVLATVLRDAHINAFVGGHPVLSDRSRESFRELRVNLDLISLDRPFKTILVTSAGPGEGKSTVVRNVAVAFGEAGRRVAVIDADLRRPALPAAFGVDTRAGLTDVLARSQGLDAVLRSVRLPDAEAVSRSAGAAGNAGNGSGGWPGVELTLLPAGFTPPNPAVLIESGAFRSVVRHMADSHDVVIIDSTPLISVSDVIPLLGHVDAVVLVARSGKTDTRGARHAAEVIGRVPNVNFVGVVVNDLGVEEATAYGAGYGSGYGYGGGSSAKSRNDACEGTSAPTGPGP
jgi:succinoglycan biosynthesis transport protein ExoP